MYVDPLVELAGRLRRMARERYTGRLDVAARLDGTTVEVRGHAFSGRGQYAVRVVGPRGVVVEGEVKRGSLTVLAGRPGSVVEAVEALNRVLSYYDVLQAATSLPSDSGEVRWLEVAFDLEGASYPERTVRVPLRTHVPLP